MMKSLILISLGAALKDKSGRKVICNIAKNGFNMVSNELKKNTGIDLSNTMSELVKDTNKIETKGGGEENAL